MGYTIVRHKLNQFKHTEHPVCNNYSNHIFKRIFKNIIRSWEPFPPHMKTTSWLIAIICFYTLSQLKKKYIYIQVCYPNLSKSDGIFDYRKDMVYCLYRYPNTKNVLTFTVCNFRLLENPEVEKPEMTAANRKWCSRAPIGAAWCAPWRSKTRLWRHAEGEGARNGDIRWRRCVTEINLMGQIHSLSHD